MTYYEKINAAQLLKEKKATIKNLRENAASKEEINKERKSANKYSEFLQRAKHGNGFAFKESTTYKLFEKKYLDLSPDELRQYNRIKQQESRSRRKETKRGVLKIDSSPP